MTALRIGTDLKMSPITLPDHPQKAHEIIQSVAYLLASGHSS
ncbi:hypothetical protein [Streptomyces longispororuber]|nr:hypothetical protein [Streptomyces longispororuber]